MIKKILIVITTFIIIVLSACNNENYQEVDQDNMNIFPKQQTGYIGDVMPFYNDGSWEIFYLHDKAATPGFHPWYRMSTSNFYEYEDHGLVLDYVDDFNSPELALATGSIIFKDGLYYAFYTMFNNRLDIHEQIGLATSTDLKTWHKDNDFLLNAQSYPYDNNNFRDPHVVYIPEYNEYYMLITTRQANRGVIAYFSSTDLINWEDQGIFFDNSSLLGTSDETSNLECPTLVYFNGFWYLTFSDQWPNRVTHYLYTNNLANGFQKANISTFDGKGLYAGKIAASDDKMILAGWVANTFNSEGEFSWGGQLIIHELIQRSDGTLGVKLTYELENKINNKQQLVIVSRNKNMKLLNNSYLTYDKLKGISKITGKIKINHPGEFGLFFSNQINSSSFLYKINSFNNEISFGRGSFNNLASFEMLTTNKINNKMEYNFTLLFEEGDSIYGSIVSLYLNEEISLTGRLFNQKDVYFGFYSNDANIELINIELFM